MADWHPIMAAVEGPPGTWRMVDPDGREYGRIEIRRVNAGQTVAYRAERDGVVLGWATSLRLACWKIHGDMLAGLAPRGGPVAGWGQVSRRRDLLPGGDEAAHRLDLQHHRRTAPVLRLDDGPDAVVICDEPDLEVMDLDAGGGADDAGNGNAVATVGVR